jgi:Na+/proline symporter
MGINLNQVKKAYLWSSLALTAFLFAVCYFAWLLFQINPHIAPNKILLTLLDLFTFDGTKAILVIGIISMCMSTADSNLNIAAVLIANDTYKLNTFDKFQKLYFARGMTIIIGLLSLLFCFKEGSLLDIIIFAHTFYMPIIVPPFLAATFGFKTTERCALITMGVTFVFVVIFKFILKYKFNIIAPAMLFNLIILATSHYLIEKWEVLKCFGITSKLKEAKNA